MNNSNIVMTSITISLFLKNLWPQCHCSINNCKPKGDKRHKVIKLIRPVHNQTQHHHKEVKPEHNLKDRQRGHIVYIMLCSYALFFIKHFSLNVAIINIYIDKQFGHIYFVTKICNNNPHGR